MGGDATLIPASEIEEARLASLTGDANIRTGGARHSMLKSVMTVGGWTMASRVLGFIRDMLLSLIHI